MAYVEALLGMNIGNMVEAALAEFNAKSVQTDATPQWEEGRCVDMDAFDQLPKPIRDFINEHNSFYPIEDVLYEHRHEHGGDYELTLVWLLECQDLERELEAKGFL